MREITCEYCGNSSLPFGNVSVDLTLSKSEITCHHCNGVNTAYQHMMFCTIRCLNEYMKEVSDGKRQLAWKEHTVYKAD